MRIGLEKNYEKLCSKTSAKSDDVEGGFSAVIFAEIFFLAGRGHLCKNYEKIRQKLSLTERV